MDNSFWNNIFYYCNVKFTITTPGCGKCLPIRQDLNVFYALKVKSKGRAGYINLNVMF